MKVVNDLLLSLNKGNISLLPLLDFSSAFHTIDCFILVHHHHADFGFTGTAIHWFLSYLTGCTQYVSLSNHCSAFALVHSGVPHCFVCSPILLSMYAPCMPLSTIIYSHSIMHHSLAVDLQSHVSASPDKDNKAKLMLVASKEFSISMPYILQ